MEGVQLVTWVVNNEEYAVEVENVQEIIRITHITRMPLSQDYLPGVINLRGTVIPVMNMAKRLNSSDLTLSESSRIIVVTTCGITAGLLVDRVCEILRLELSSIEPQDMFSSAESNKYIKGIGKIGKRVLLILDLEKNLDLR